jgi:hypothetical protein
MKPATRSLWRAKLKAFAIHVGISAVVFVVVIATLIRLWYPEPYFWIDGGLYVMTVAAFVDIGLGPSISLAIFRPHDKRMPLVYALIGLAQLAALGGGVHLLYEYRPLFVAFVGFPRNEFFPVTEAMLRGAASVPREMIAQARERPALVYIDRPADTAEWRRMLMAGRTGEKTVFQHTELYRSAEGAWRSRILTEGARSKARIEAVFAARAASIQAYVDAHGGSYDAFVFVPLNARYGRGMLVFDRASARLLTTLEL